MWKSLLCLGVAARLRVRRRHVRATANVCHNAPGGGGVLGGSTPSATPKTKSDEFGSQPNQFHGILSDFTGDFTEKTTPSAAVAVAEFLQWIREFQPDEIMKSEWISWDFTYKLFCEMCLYKGFHEISAEAYCKAMSKTGVAKKLLRINSSKKTVKRPRIIGYNLRSVIS